MPTPKFDRDRAAKILIDAVLIGDRATCDKWGISVKSLQRYRIRLSEDESLSQLVADKKEISDRGWAAEIPSMLQSGIDFLKRAAQEANTRDADVIHSIAGAVKIVSEVQAMRDVIDARILGQARSDGEEDRSVVAKTEGGDR